MISSQNNGSVKSAFARYKFNPLAQFSGGKKAFIGATLVVTGIVFTVPSQATLSTVDWITLNDGLITLDDYGLEWLDLSVTSDRSYDDVSSKFDAGEEFEGWRYATRAEVAGLWDSAGGDNSYYTGWTTQNNGLFDSLAPYIDDLYCIEYGCPTGDGYSGFITADAQTAALQWAAIAFDKAGAGQTATQDYFETDYAAWGKDVAEPDWGSALVRSAGATVAEPGTLILLSAGLAGLGFGRRKVKAKL